MAGYKYKFPIYEIVDEEGDLKFLFNLEINHIPNIGEQIVVLDKDENGKPIHRYYFVIIHKIIPTTLDSKESVIYHEDKMDFILYVKKQVDEPIL